MVLILLKASGNLGPGIPRKLPKLSVSGDMRGIRTAHAASSPVDITLCVTQPQMVRIVHCPRECAGLSLEEVSMCNHQQHTFHISPTNPDSTLCTILRRLHFFLKVACRSKDCPSTLNHYVILGLAEPSPKK